MRMRTLIGMVVAAGVLAVSVAWAAEAASAQGEAGHHGRLASTPIGRLITGQVGRLLTLKSQMNLSPSQREQVRAAVESHRAEIAAVAKELVARHRAVQAQVMAEKSDEQGIRAATAEMGKSLGDAAVLAARIRAEVAPLLTEPQKKLLERFHADTQEAVDQWLSEIAQGK